jgi:hypothetical protein
VVGGGGGGGGGGVGLGLRCSTTLTTIFQLYCGSHIYLLMEKTTNLPPATDKFYHMMLYRVHQAMSKIRTHNASCDIH